MIEGSDDESLFSPVFFESLEYPGVVRKLCPEYHFVGTGQTVRVKRDVVSQADRLSFRYREFVFCLFCHGIFHILVNAKVGKLFESDYFCKCPYHVQNRQVTGCKLWNGMSENKGGYSFLGSWRGLRELLPNNSGAFIRYSLL